MQAWPSLFQRWFILPPPGESYDSLLDGEYGQPRSRLFFGISTALTWFMTGYAARRLYRRPTRFNAGVVAMGAFLLIGEIAVTVVYTQGMHAVSCPIFHYTACLPQKVFKADWYTLRVHRCIMGVNVLLMLVTVVHVVFIVAAWDGDPAGGAVVEQAVGALVVSTQLGFCALTENLLMAATLWLVLGIRKALVSNIDDPNAIWGNRTNKPPNPAARRSPEEEKERHVLAGRVIAAIVCALLLSFASIATFLTNHGMPGQGVPLTAHTIFTHTARFCLDVFLSEILSRLYLISSMVEWSLVVTLLSAGRHHSVPRAPPSADRGL